MLAIFIKESPLVQIRRDNRGNVQVFEDTNRWASIL